MSQGPHRAVLLGFGSPASLDELPQFLARVTGRPATPEMLSRARDRYSRISGSPFLEISERQARGLEALLNRQGPRWQVFLGFLHSAPSIAEAVAQITARSIARAIGLPLTPFTSAISTGAYAGAAEEAVRQSGRTLELRFITCFHDHPLFLDAVAEKLDQVFWEHPDLTRTTTPVLFTAHSLPARIADHVFLWGFPENVCAICKGLRRSKQMCTIHLYIRQSRPEGKECDFCLSTCR